MQRRDLLRSGAAGAVLAAHGGVARAAGAAWREYEVRTTVSLRERAGPASLALPVLGSAGQHQVVVDTRWTSDGVVRLERDARYSAPMLNVTWTGAEPGREAVLVQRVRVRDRSGAEPAVLGERERALWLAPTASAPTDGIVRETALRITDGAAHDRGRVRAIYDWVVDRTHRDPEVAGCGTGDVALMLRQGRFGGKCADINGLFVALTRACGIPARDVYGIRLGPATWSASLGPKTGDVSKAQHCRAEAYLAGEGWFPVDPADVRKVILEEGGDGSHVRDRLFGGWEMNWAGYNSATDIKLPGGERPDFPFLMYPCAVTAEGSPSCVDPAAFSYRIDSKLI